MCHNGCLHDESNIVDRELKSLEAQSLCNVHCKWPTYMHCEHLKIVPIMATKLQFLTYINNDPQSMKVTVGLLFRAFLSCTKTSAGQKGDCLAAQSF